MNKEPSLTDTSQIRTIEMLQHALDNTYRRLVETAKADWQRLFAEPDPADMAKICGSDSRKVQDNWVKMCDQSVLGDALKAYAKAGRVKTETARLLGIKNSALYYKLEKYGIE